MEYLERRAVLHVVIDCSSDALLFGSDYSGDWFNVREFGVGSVLDRTVSFSLIHPELKEEAETIWGDDPRVKISIKPENGSYDDVRLTLLKKYGIPEGTSTWMWAYEALSIAERTGEVMNLPFRLSDFVEWTCSDEPPNMHVGAEFGDPEIFADAVFGQWLDHPDYQRLEGCNIWKTNNGKYVSPVWEYLSWRSESYRGFEEYARNLADIGEGLNSAVLTHDPSADPGDPHRARLTATRIFRAGEAVTKLKIKLDLEGIVLNGLKSERAGKTRAAKGGDASAAARAARRDTLMAAVEAVIARNPDLAMLGIGVVKPLALEKCVKDAPNLWKQGKGQVDDYLGEIRRGEAGDDMQARYFDIFPAQPLKRFRD